MIDPLRNASFFEPEAMGQVADAIYKLRTQFQVIKDNEDILRNQVERLKKEVLELEFWEQRAYSLATQLANKNYDGLAPDREESVIHHAMSLLGKDASRELVLGYVKGILK